MEKYLAATEGDDYCLLYNMYKIIRLYLAAEWERPYNTMYLCIPVYKQNHRLTFLTLSFKV